MVCIEAVVNFGCTGKAAKDPAYRSTFVAAVLREADKIIGGVDAQPLLPYNSTYGPGYRLGFFEYPKACAYS